MSISLVSIRCSAPLLLCLLTAIVVLPSCAAENSGTAKMVQDATTGAKDTRYTAIDDLGERHAHASQVVRPLEKMLTDEDPQVRWRTARTLGEYGSQAKSSAASLRKLLTDNDPIVQYHAAIALGKIDDKSDETVEALIAVATSKDARVARAAIAALHELKPGPQRVAEALANALKSNDKAVALHALEAIVEEGKNALPLLKEALGHPETAYVACAAIEQLGPEAAPVVPELAGLLGTTKHSQLLIQELLALAAIGPGAESAAPQIKPLLATETDATVPVAAAYALGSIGAKDADAELQAATEKSDPFLKMIATWALAKLHPDDQAALKAAVDQLTQGLKNDDVTIRNAAAKSLQSLQAPPEMVGPALVELMNDPSPEVHANAIEAIASLGESVVPKVSNALTNPKLRNAAIRVLRKLGPKASGAVQPLIEAANGADPKFVTDIQLTLGAIGPAAAPATDMLIKSIGSKDAGERESALYALRKIGPDAKAAVEPLMQRMKADDTFDADASAWALSRIAPSDPSVAAAVVPKLIKGLSAADEQSRLEAVEALTDMHATAESTAALENTAKEDSSEMVRAAAEEALKKK